MVKPAYTNLPPDYPALISMKKSRGFCHDETIWTTQKAMSELFGVGVPVVNKHSAIVYDERVG